MTKACIDITPYALPLSTPYRWSKGVQTVRSGLLVRIEVDGAVGWGETAPAPHLPVDGPALKAEAEAAVADLDPTAGDFIERLDDRSPEIRIRTGISTAYFAQQAAQAGLSFAAFLGRGWRTPRRG